MKKYYINLERSKDRRKFMENMYDDLIRIDAYDGLKLNEYTDIILPKQCNESNGALACSLSHIKAIITAYENGDEEALILEDDTSNEYKDKWEKSIKDIVKEAPQDTECLSLFCSNNLEMDKMLSSDKNYFRWNIHRWSTGCYYINRKGMEKIYNKYYKNNNIDISLKLTYYTADGDIIYNSLITYNYKIPTFSNVLFGSIIGNVEEQQTVIYNYLKKYFNNF